MNAAVVDGASVSYGTTEVLHGVSLRVPSSAWLGLIGPNGAGKSTLLRAMAALVPHTGNIRLHDRPIAELSRREIAREVAYVPQNPIVPLGMPVLHYVLMGRTPYISYLGVESDEDLQAATDVLARLDLHDLAARPLGSLSGGELQRAVLGRALAQGASILLLDEPTTALDVGRGSEVLELVESLRVTHGLTVVSAMHDLTLAAQFAERLVLLRDGTLVADGSPGEVLTEEALAAHYRARVRVIDHPEGGLVVAPARSNGDRGRA